MVGGIRFVILVPHFSQGCTGVLHVLGHVAVQWGLQGPVVCGDVLRPSDLG